MKKLIIIIALISSSCATIHKLPTTGGKTIKHKQPRNSGLQVYK